MALIARARGCAGCRACAEQRQRPAGGGPGLKRRPSCSAAMAVGLASARRDAAQRAKYSACAAAYMPKCTR